MTNTKVISFVIQNLNKFSKWMKRANYLSEKKLRSIIMFRKRIILKTISRVRMTKMNSILKKIQSKINLSINNKSNFRVKMTSKTFTLCLSLKCKDQIIDIIKKTQSITYQETFPFQKKFLKTYLTIKKLVFSGYTIYGSSQKEEFWEMTWG
jgi:hypothetical protein